MSQLQEKVTQENEDNSRYDPKASELPLNAERVGTPGRFYDLHLADFA